MPRRRRDEKRRSSVDEVSVLVVDDQPDNLRLEMDLLAAYGVKVTGVSSAAGAIDVLKSGQRPDVVLADVNLRARPGDRSGILMAQTIREEFPDVEVVGYSASIRDLGRRETAVFRYFFARGDDQPEALVAGAIKAALRGSVPRVPYPLIALDLVSDPLKTYDGPDTVGDPPTDGTEREEDEDLMDDDGICLVLRPGGRGASLDHPVKVLAYEGEDLISLVVESYPELGGEGKDLDDAAADLVDVMEAFREDLTSEPPEALGPAVRALQAFLNSVLPTANAS